ncbi:sensor histidine kinase [Dactylosporangium sp. NPDC051541]|uniref:sensor histidine kinase n=1 Tax=Dactylosporangium sp. NPDC051541 TaxID=3363977 RepID=UPI0037A64DD8
MSGVRVTGPAIAAGLFALAVAEVATTAVAGVVSGLSLAALVDGFAVSSATLGLALAVAGWPIAWHRPGNVVGWLLLAGGICYALSAAGYALLAAGAAPGEHGAGWRVVATLTNVGWTWVISLVLPVVLLVFPDGRLLGRGWRWVVLAAVADAVAFAATAVAPADTLSGKLGVRGYPAAASSDLTVFAGVTSVLGFGVYGAAVLSLVLRYRRGDERVRRQLLWLLLAALVMVTTFVVSDVLRVEGWWSIFVVALVPIAISVAVLRHQLLDIRLVISRSVLYLLLTTAVVAGYALLVTGLDAVVRREVGLGSSVLATLVVAAGFNPVRVWLQHRLDRVFYGARHDPVRAIAEIGERIGAIDATGLDGVLEAVCRVLRLPSAAIVAQHRELATYGAPPPLRRSVPLQQGGEHVGELIVGLRPGEARLDPADERILALVSTSIAVAVHATALAEALGRTREALVTAREEERRRLRRDLHDGLGPALTGVVLQADTARRIALTDPQRAAEVMAQLRVQTTAAIDDIRRLVNELRPPALDGLGLLGALREHAEVLSQRTDGSPLRVTVAATGPLPDLPAAVEVAAYRIATEALNNITRHSTATTATIRLDTDNATMTLEISDNGGGSRPWQPGVGLTSMRERVAELGGHCCAGAGASGGQVRVTLPLQGRR